MINIEIDEKMRDFIVQHFEKRIAFRKKHMPEYNDDPWLQFANAEDDKTHRESVAAGKKKALEFIHKAHLVIEALKEKATPAKK